MSCKDNIRVHGEMVWGKRLTPTNDKAYKQESMVPRNWNDFVKASQLNTAKKNEPCLVDSYSSTFQLGIKKLQKVTWTTAKYLTLYQNSTKTNQPNLMAYGNFQKQKKCKVALSSFFQIYKFCKCCVVASCKLLWATLNQPIKALHVEFFPFSYLISHNRFFYCS